MSSFLSLRSARLRALLLPCAVVLASCESTSPSMRHVTLSVVTTPTGVTPAASWRGGISADVVVGSGPNSIRITSVEFVLAKTELSDAGTCSTPPANDDNCDEMELAPLLINLPLTTAPPTQVLDALVPPGTYTKLEAELRSVDPGDDEEGEAAFLAAHPTWAGLSVKVSGVYTDGAGAQHAFTFTSSVDADIEIEFTSPITVDATTQNLTLTVDVSKWFINSSGAVIDPASSANAAAINANIRASFQAFEDNDEDGDDDNAGIASVGMRVTP